MEDEESCSAKEAPIPDSSRRERRKHATGRSRCTDRSSSSAAPRNESQATPIPSATAATVACANPAVVRLPESGGQENGQREKLRERPMTKGGDEARTGEGKNPVRDQLFRQAFMGGPVRLHRARDGMILPRSQKEGGEKGAPEEHRCADEEEIPRPHGRTERIFRMVIQPMACRTNAIAMIVFPCIPTRFGKKPGSTFDRATANNGGSSVRTDAWSRAWAVMLRSFSVVRMRS